MCEGAEVFSLLCLNQEKKKITATKTSKFIKSCSKVLPQLARHTLANVPKHSHPRSVGTHASSISKYQLLASC